MHILIVDDEKLISWSIQKLLLKRGHHVDVCHSISDALERVRHGSFDLVISDYVMPDGKGDVLIKAVREKKNQTRFIMMSGAIPAALVEQLGADAYIEKPFVMAELQAVIDRAFQGDGSGTSK